VPHAANEAFCSIDASADHVVWPSGKFKNPPVVNLTNISKQLLHQSPWTKKLQSHTVIRENLCKTLLYEKAARKMLVKLTPRLSLLVVDGQDSVVLGHGELNGVPFAVAVCLLE